MSREQSELEGRLDDMLSRIAMETQEIKELEQQLTDGQILANECLQRDLEGIIRGLQDYLRGLRDQARHSQQQLVFLREENQSLQSHLDQTRTHLDYTRTHLDQMTAVLMDPQEGQSGPEELDQDQSRPARPEDLLARSLDQLHRVVQQTRTSRQQLHQDQDHVARLQAQVAQDHDHIAQMEAQVAQDHDHIAQMEAQVAQDQDHIAQMEAQVAQDRDALRHQLRSQSKEHQRIVGSLSRKLQRSRRSDHLTDQLTADQLRDTCDQLRALNQILQEEEEEEVTLEEAQRHKVHRTRTRTRDPGLSAPSLVSVGTRDSGLSSPDQTPRGRTHLVSAGLDGPAWLTCNQHTHTTQRCVCECVLRAAERLEEEKKRVRHTLRQHRRVLQVCDQVECVERTLLKRRAELREADRRLLEAQRHTHTWRQQQRQGDEDLRLISVKTELNTHRAELKLLLQEVLRQQQLLQDLKNKRTQSQQEVDRKQEELDRKQEELNMKEEELDRKQEELNMKQEERSRLQQQCKHLENRRRHADRTLSELHDDITRKRAEHDQALLLKQGVVRDLAAAEEQLSEKADFLCLVSERVEEQQRRLQNLDGDGEAAGDEG